MAAKIEEPTAEMSKVTAARNKNLDLAIQQIAKDYGEGAIMRLGSALKMDVEVKEGENLKPSDCVPSM